MGNLLEHDILYAYQTDYDMTGTGLLTHQVLSEIIGFDAKGKPIVKLLSGTEYLNDAAGMRFVKVGNTIDPDRQSGIFFDTITAQAPRMVVYDGLNSADKLFSSSLTISQIGKLGDIYNAKLGGYLTDDATANGNPLKGIYTKSLFADLSGDSKLSIVEDSDNYFTFDNGMLSISATRFNLTMGASGIIQIKDAGAGASGYVLDAAGLRGYDSTLGLVFNLPTDGSKPTFSSGIIKEVEFEMYTSGIIRTSSTVGNGTADSAGFLANNTGLYICSANQTPATADIRLVPGNSSFKGAVTITGSTNALLQGGAAADINNNTTTINGGKITTNTITLSQLNFTPITGTNVIATINASTEGIKITGDKIDFVGSVTFSMLDSSTQGIINSKTTTSDVTTIIGNTLTTGYVIIGISLTSPVITGGTFQTATTGQRVVIDNSNSITFYNNNNYSSSISTNTNASYPQLNISSSYVNVSAAQFMVSGLVGAQAYNCNGFGSNGYVLRSDGVNGYVGARLNSSDLNNDVGYATQSWVNSQGFLANSVLYFGTKSATIGNTSSGTPLYSRTITDSNGTTVSIVTLN